MKHLNPRQGITTEVAQQRLDGLLNKRVKHLNPRQGITTHLLNNRRCAHEQIGQCETPKSPPGDYNSELDRVIFCFAVEQKCETPKSPPGDYNSESAYL